MITRLPDWSNTEGNRSRPVAQNYSKVPVSQGFSEGNLDNVSVSKQRATSQFLPLKSGLVVSCQVPDGTPIDTPEFIAAQAATVVEAGAVGIRAQGIANVRAVAQSVNVPIIGLVKRYLDSTPIYITPLIVDVIELEAAGATIVAVDATERLRTDNVTFSKFMTELREHSDIPILADVDSLESAIVAESLGCNAIATTLSGYTDIPAPELPNIELVERIANRVKVPIVAEGGYTQQEQVTQALNAGAWSVCIGTAITNPFLLTKHFLRGILER